MILKVGYISSLGLTNDVLSESGYVWQEHELETKAKSLELDALIVAGGISSNFDTTYKFMEILGDRLKRQGILLRFIAGNTDFYSKDVGVDKEKSFREKKEKYLFHPYYLTSHAIIRSNLVISGIESWYDYSLYRGKPIELRKILKKKTLFSKNLDSIYITDVGEYVLGVDSVFDTRYNNECLHLFEDRLRQVKNRLGSLKYNVVVQYFYPSRAFLSKSAGVFDSTGYFDAFRGSAKYFPIMVLSGNVTDCVVGMRSEKKSLVYNGIRCKTCDSEIQVVEYDL